MKKALRQFGAKIASLVSMLVAAFDVRDVFVFGGLLLVWHGLYLWIPWISFVAVGILVMLLGLDVKGFIVVISGGARGGDHGRS